MDPSNLLSQLRDIHAPDPISYWPPAPGWWLLLIILIISLSAGIYFLVSSWRSKQWKRQAKQQFKHLRDTYSTSPSTEVVVEINKLLKQVLSSARNDRQFLQTHGESWEAALLSVKKNKHSVLNTEETQILSRDIYSSKQSRLDKDMLDRIAIWIRVVK